MERTFTANRLRSYAICFLVLFYFQQEYEVDSLWNSINYQGKGIWGWWVEVKDYLKDFDRSFLKNVSMIELLKGFFDYYSNFDFTSFVICPYIGEVVTKRQLFNPISVPEQYFHYREHLLLDPERESIQFKN